jgi:hypothetical protein
MLKTILTIFFLFLTACTTSNNTREFAPVPLDEGQSAVYIYRPSVMANALYSPDFYINEELKFSVKNGEKSRTVLPAGNHVFKLDADNNQSNQKTLSLNLRPGETYYLRVSTTLKVHNTSSYQPYQRNYSLENIPKKNAEMEITECCMSDDKIKASEPEIPPTTKQPDDGFSVDKTHNPFSH